MFIIFTSKDKTWRQFEPYALHSWIRSMKILRQNQEVKAFQKMQRKLQIFSVQCETGEFAIKSTKNFLKSVKRGLF